MSANFQWNVTKLQVKSNVENLENVVVSAEWRLIASDAGVSVERIGAESFNLQTEGFTPFESLTEQQVLGWINERVNKELAESMLAEAIEQKRNPPIVEKTLPWAA